MNDERLAELRVEFEERQGRNLMEELTWGTYANHSGYVNKANGEFINWLCNAAYRELKKSDRPQGEWIYGEHDVAMCDGYRCDRCGFFVPWDYEHKSIDFINDYKFCPSCGARMKGASDVHHTEDIHLVYDAR